MASADENEPFALMTAVTKLIHDDPCQECLPGKVAAHEMFVAYVRRLSRKEKRASMLTALSILFVADEAQPRRVRSTGQRIRFNYYIPFVGRVCKTTFVNAYGISSSTLDRYRRMICEGKVLEEYEDEL